MNKMEFDIFFDFAWPFVYNAAVWLDKVKKHYGENLQLNWRNFSLQQINAKDPGDWKVWQEEDYTTTRSLMA